MHCGPTVDVAGENYEDTLVQDNSLVRRGGRISRALRASVLTYLFKLGKWLRTAREAVPPTKRAPFLSSDVAVDVGFHRRSW